MESVSVFVANLNRFGMSEFGDTTLRGLWQSFRTDLNEEERPPESRRPYPMGWDISVNGKGERGWIYSSPSAS